MGFFFSILVLLIVFILTIAIVAIIISAMSKKNQTGKSSLETSIRGIYGYAVLIITLFAIIGGIIVTFRVGLDILLPEKNTYTTYNYDKKEKNENIVEVLTTLSLVITCIPIFTYHNKLTKELREIKNIEKVSQ